jgi:FlaA1/EpsC-like NDP-sugar epimerase
MSGVALIVKIPTYFYFGRYRRLWVYASTNELRLITLAMTAAPVITSGIMSIILLVVNRTDLVLGMPRSAMGIDWLISLVLIGGSCFAFRILNEQSGAKSAKERKAIIIGAGDAGALVVSEQQKSSQLGLHPIGFLDDDPAKQRHEIYGVPVIGKVTDLASVLDNQQVDEVVITIPSAR